ncbi:hypothetical protein KDA_10260 [Dictyobacter alpinus]|uniref:LIM zinc-binding domain-containing protein n=1 Tax=Dictyobacter alpinus TaxID=2014873 RepID=A0A402B2G7_9CHLR|nr:protein DA1 [Dictyobacter alpinus]GCE25542.1 hypothetical protein KDA_10260 [Dictyobacter alpinus]
MSTVQPVCKGCGQAIWGNYLRALGATWHPEHFLCAGCGQAIQGTSFQVHQGSPYHVECYRRQIAPHCVYCDKPLMGEYLVDYWGQKFCREHEKQFAHCAYCGRLVSPEQQESGAQAVRCPICRSTAIETSSEAKPLFSHVIRWMNAQGLMYNNLKLSLDLCGRAHLADLLREGNVGHSLGATTSAMYTQNGRLVRTEINGIAVLQGLPAILFQGVTVHELGHVWLIVAGAHDLPPWAEEGFCELLSYRYYVEANTPESRYHSTSKERNPDPIYGEGFRRMRQLSDRVGFPRLIESLRTTGNLPVVRG